MCNNCSRSDNRPISNRYTWCNDCMPSNPYIISNNALLIWRKIRTKIIDSRIEFIRSVNLAQTFSFFQKRIINRFKVICDIFSRNIKACMRRNNVTWMIWNNAGRFINTAKRTNAFAKALPSQQRRIIKSIFTNMAMMIHMRSAQSSMHRIMFMDDGCELFRDERNGFFRHKRGDCTIDLFKKCAVVEREEDPRLFVDHVLREHAHRQDVFVVAAQLVVHDDGVLDAVTLLQDVIRQEAQFAVRINYEPCPPDSYCCSMHLHTA